MARAVKYHEKVNAYGWPLFTSTQTDTRLALCKKALCPDRRMLIRIKDCYESEAVAQTFCKLEFTCEDDFDYVLGRINHLAWGGKYAKHKFALEGGFYPFVRCIELHRPLDVGCIWIGTRHEYPRIYVDNLVARWVCPYSKMGHVMIEPFEPLDKVIQNWEKLADYRYYPCLSLPPVPGM